MRKLLVVAVALALGIFVARLYIGHRLEREMLQMHPQGKHTPQSVFEAIDVHSGGRTLHSFYVPADGPGVLIFHGNGESISGWSDALDLLHKSGVAAMVFDYSGFGNSQGPATLANFHEDGLEAWRVFRTRLPAATRACVYGLSLGSAVLLDVEAELQPPPDCVAISGAFLSARDAAVQLKRIPPLARWLLPDVLDNLENIALVHAPLLIEHGTADDLFPPAWASKLAAARPGAQLALVQGMKHADPVVHPSAVSWDPIIHFLKLDKPTPR